MRDAGADARILKLIDQVLDLPPGERESWVRQQCGDDRATCERLLSMLSRSEDASDFLQTGGAPAALHDAPMPERIGAYRITGLIGQGGMGAVYRGERAAGDFEHVAAIKLIRAGALSDALIERFQRERQTLARLSHPNIARLFDGGETEAKDPYIVMECVEGVPLGTWLDQERPTEQRIGLFLQVCSAVAFAHQNLIIHRDITPSNVLVEPDGTAKLIDFGIARPAAADAEGPSEVAGVQLSLTPGYAAPERIGGAPATTLSDIYSLGMLLGRMLPEVQDRDLRAIIPKASAGDPADRYPTVAALADDVVAWRDGFAVGARGGGRGYAIGKFVGRHKPAVSAAAAALLLLIAALALTLAANSRAEAARAEAERRFEQTRSIAKTLLFDAYDEVGKVPGSTTAKEMLARTGLTYLDALAADASAPLDVRVEVGRGYTRLANVVGGGGAGNLGKYADANQLLEKAQAVLGAAYREQPDNPAVRRGYAELLVEQAAVGLYNNNDAEGARKLGREAATLMRPIALSNADSAETYASALQVIGDSYGWNDDWAQARPAHQAAERFHASLPAALARDRRIMTARSSNLRLLGEAHHKLKENGEARRTLDEAVAINRKLLAAAPDDPTAIRKLATALWYRAVVHRTNKRDALAGQSITEAVALAEKMRVRAPNDAGALQIVALVGEVQAQVLADLGRFQESFAAGERVTTAHRHLVDLAGNTPGARRSMAAALRTRGGNHYSGGDYAGACRIWAEALGIFASLERSGDLTDVDRNNGVPELKEFMTQGCSPPRRAAAIDSNLS